MKFEPGQATENLGPFLVEQALSDIPVFGPEKADIAAITDETLQNGAPDDDLLVDHLASEVPLSEAFTRADTVAEKLKVLRLYIWGLAHPDSEKLTSKQSHDPTMLVRLQDGQGGPTKQSSRSLHEALLQFTMETAGFPKVAQAVLDNVMLLRAKEKYLFDCQVNSAVVDDDPWLKGVWGWIGGTASTHPTCVLSYADNQQQMLKKPVSTVGCWPILWISAT